MTTSDEMTKLTARPYSNENDLQPVVDLINCCSALDKLGTATSPASLKVEFEAPEVDSVQLWEIEGKLVGMAALMELKAEEALDGYLNYYVHPEHRQGHLEKQILEWAEARWTKADKPQKLKRNLLTSAKTEQTAKINSLERHGFTVIRYFLVMERSLSEALPALALPEGFQLRQVSGEADAERWVAMFNQSFVDHFNFHPMTVENYLHELNNPEYFAENDLVVVAPGGEFAAFCYLHVPEAENVQSRCREGWIDLLGTRRGYRKMGLGKAALLAGLRRLQALDMETALLSVDADSPTGATRLYESVGFAKRSTRLRLRKSIS
ncbi:MAG TPA: GNAT family N-acetyltransferase [Chloroflexia bacterium]|nr:GNAT family N-acetyltransferase [Chloroflexia bacterium]